ncbi:hypothetical protein [Flammeovirga aprica]|uniref:Uncharacterized protein n=1 Tax=Flammeovirga aprica JL-4 TaxID=694437 RepID=A0A7X9RZT0_9BACT|nr:hypothetical protein [Flammeovirga aprica]NME71704.1 hypothetical protein [Flammeovirga aprica JL-4]
MKNLGTKIIATIFCWVLLQQAFAQTDIPPTIEVGETYNLTGYHFSYEEKVGDGYDDYGNEVEYYELTALEDIIITNNAGEQVFYKNFNHDYINTNKFNTFSYDVSYSIPFTFKDTGEHSVKYNYFAYRVTKYREKYYEPGNSTPKYRYIYYDLEKKYPVDPKGEDEDITTIICDSFASGNTSNISFSYPFGIIDGTHLEKGCSETSNEGFKDNSVYDFGFTHQFSIKKKDENNIYRNVQPNEISFDASDLKNFTIYASGVYRLYHTYNFSCSAISNTRTDSIDFTTNIAIVDPSLITFYYPFGITDGKEIIESCMAYSNEGIKNDLESNSPNIEHHFVIQKKEGYDNYIDVQSDDIFYNSSDLKNFGIYSSGEYRLYHHYQYSCDDSLYIVKDTLDFTAEIDPVKFDYSFLYTDGLVECEYNRNGEFKKVNPNHTLVSSEFTLFRLNNNGSYTSIGFKDKKVKYTSDLNTLIINAKGNYLLKHKYSCNSGSTSSVIVDTVHFGVDVIDKPVGVNEDDCPSCEYDNFNAYQQDADNSESISGKGFDLGTFRLEYRYGCNQNWSLVPTKRDTKTKFMKIHVGDQIQFRFTATSGNYMSSGGSDKERRILRISDIKKGVIQNYDYHNSERKRYQIVMDVDFSQDKFLEGGIFKLEARGYAYKDNGGADGGGGVRNALAYLCVTTIPAPVYTDNEEYFQCQDQPIEIDFNSGNYTNVRATFWDDSVKKDHPEYNQYIGRHIYTDLQSNNKTAIPANNFVGTKWLELQNTQKRLVNNDTLLLLSNPLATLKKVTVYPSPPSPETTNIVILDTDRMYDVVNYISDRQLTTPNHSTQSTDILEYAIYDGDSLRMSYKESGHNTFNLTDSTSYAEVLVRRKVSYHIEKTVNGYQYTGNPNIEYSRPTKFFFIARPVVIPQVICPTKYKFSIANDPVLDNREIRKKYYWTVKDNSTQEVLYQSGGNGGSNILIYDFNEHAQGVLKQYDITVKIVYVPQQNTFNHDLEESKVNHCSNDNLIEVSGESRVTTIDAPRDFRMAIVNYQENNDIYTNVLSNASHTYSDAWLLNEANVSSKRLSPWLGAKAGVWRNDRSYFYTGQRRYDTSSRDLRGDGAISSFNAMGWKGNHVMADTKIENDDNNTWVKNHTITQYNKRGHSSEQQDALGNYSAVLFSTDGQFVTATGANMRQDEMLFTSFEEGNKQDLFFENRKIYKFPVYAGRKLLAVIGDNGVDLGEVLEDNQTLVTVRGTEYEEELPKPFVLDAVISCRFDYIHTADTLHETLGATFSDGDSTKENYSIIGLDGYGFDALSNWVGEIVIVDSVIQQNTGIQIIQDLQAHTGEYVAEINGTKSIKLNHLSLDDGKKYSFSAWIKVPALSDYVTDYKDELSIVVNEDTIQSIGKVIEGWQQVKGSFTYSGEKYDGLSFTFLTGSNKVRIDDLRIHPLNGNMNSYYYDPYTYRLQTTLDENNYATSYSYDEEGNLKLLQKETARGVVTIQEVQSNITQ